MREIVFGLEYEFCARLLVSTAVTVWYCVLRTNITRLSARSELGKRVSDGFRRESRTGFFRRIWFYYYLANLSTENRVSHFRQTTRVGPATCSVRFPSRTPSISRADAPLGIADFISLHRRPSSTRGRQRPGRRSADGGRAFERTQMSACAWVFANPN